MNQKQGYFYDRGFTLIELLVVISIIIILASVVLNTISTSRAKARDTKRISDLKQIRIALELYRQDHGDYPVTTNPDYFLDNSYDNWTGSWSGTGRAPRPSPGTARTPLAASSR